MRESHNWRQSWMQSEKEKFELQKELRKLGHEVEQRKNSLSEISKVPKSPWFWHNQDLTMHFMDKIDWKAGESDILSWLNTSAIHHECVGRDGSFVANHVQGVRVWRVENPLLWKQFVLKAEELHFRHQIHNKRCEPVSPPIRQPHVFSNIDESPLDWSYDQSLNEVLLWHGTKSCNIELIAKTGFDERVCRLSGMFGAGLYFAQDSCKAGQYAEKDDKGSHWFFLSRVLLGQPYYASQALKDIRKAPDNCDSIVYEGNHSTVGHHRELVVYDRYQAYPEYIVEAYTR